MTPSGFAARRHALVVLESEFCAAREGQP